jgi:hypothetical protein
MKQIQMKMNTTTTTRREPAVTSSEAILSSADGFTSFTFGNYHIRFRAPYSLERYTKVVKWDDGYLVVMAKYQHNDDAEEEYIDLKPVLDNLYIDSASFLKPIQNVRISYA